MTKLYADIKKLEEEANKIHHFALERGVYDGHELVYTNEEKEKIREINSISKKIVGMGLNDKLTLSSLVALIERVAK